MPEEQPLQPPQQQEQQPGRESEMTPKPKADDPKYWAGERQVARQSVNG